MSDKECQESADCGECVVIRGECPKQDSIRPSSYEKILAPIADLLQRKNTDYGNSFDKLRKEYGPVSFHLRIEDKINRIKQLDTHKALVNDEAIEDTIKDIIGYCTLELIYRQEGKRNGK